MADVQRMTSSRITKRADVVVEGFLGGSLLESQALEQMELECPSDYSPCSSGIFCCKFSLPL